MNKKFKMPLCLQFFAEEPKNNNGNTPDKEPGKQGINGAQSADQDNSSDGQQDDGLNNLPDGQQDKVFTQEEMKRIAAREKRQGKQSVLNSLGIKSEDDLKRIVNAYNQFINADNPQQKKDAQGNADYEQMQERVLLAESKLAALSLGVEKDCLDDAIAIANMKAKITGDEVSDILEDMKKDKKYAGFFEGNKNVQNAPGTGSGVGHGTGTPQKKESVVERLTKDKKQKKESKYFRH